MKLRNLLAGTLYTILFAACSNETEPGGPVTLGPKSGEATLSVKIFNPQTKAVGGSESDLVVKDLCVLIFKGIEENAPLEKIGWSADELTTEVTEIPVTSGNKKVVVLANVSKEQLTGTGLGQLGLVAGEDGTAYSVVKEKALTFSGKEVNGSLSMSSKTYNVTLRVSMKNYLGYAEKNVSDTGGETLVIGSGVNTPVNLYRNVARVVLSDIAYQDNDRYPDFRLDVKEVFILHGREKSALIGDGQEWGTTHTGSTYLNGVAKTVYQDWVAKLEGSSSALPHLTDAATYAAWTEQANKYVKAYAQGEFVVASSSTVPATSPSFYVYENTDADGKLPCTLLVVKGDFSYQKDGKQEKMENRYYTLSVGVSGVEGGYDLPEGFKGSRKEALYKGVLRNLSYQISFAVAGPGSDNPLDQDQISNLSATVKVRDWNLVENNESVN